MDDPTAQLRARARAGDADAFGAVFDACAKSVYNHAFRLTGDWSTAEEVMAMAFLEAWRGRDSILADGGSLRPWLLGIATNLARGLHRTARRHRTALARLAVADELPDFADDVSGRLDDVARIKALHRALAGLPRPELEVLALCVWSGVSYADAAEALHVPVGTIRSRLSRARAKLARLTDGELRLPNGSIATSMSRPPAASPPLADGPTASHSATPTVSSPLVLLADTITASANKQPGDATLVFRSTTFTDGQAPGSGFDLYTDSGPYYWAPTESGLPAQIVAHRNLGDGLFTREIAAAEYAVHGDLATARERMADAPDPANAGKSPAAQMSPKLLKVKAEMLGVKAAPGQSLAAAYDKAWTDNWVWGDSIDALEAGAGNPQVRAGVLRLLSTVSGVVVTHGTLDGQPALVVGDVTPGLNGNGTSEGAMTLNASTGVPLQYTDGPVGKTPESTTTYKVSRVTVADIAAGKF